MAYHAAKKGGHAAAAAAMLPLPAAIDVYWAEEPPRPSEEVPGHQFEPAVAHSYQGASVDHALPLHVFKAVDGSDFDVERLASSCYGASAAVGAEVELASAPHFTTRYFESEAFVEWVKGQEEEQEGD